jgi:hypothetical protein
MRRGEFAAAWAISDAVLRQRQHETCADRPRHEQWIWRGQSLHGRRVLIRCYHGLGDTVQFIRFAPRVKAIAREVIVWAQPELLPLLHTAHGIDRLLPLHDGTPDVDYEVDVESMELAHVFRVTPETLSRDVPYLHAPAALRRSSPSARPDRHVGLVWQSGAWDPRRSVPWAKLEPLLEATGVTWHVLQRGPARAEWPAEHGVLDGSDDIAETARIMRSLDLVVSVDSFPAHLAGALGVPLWLLLSHEADWRWMEGRTDSPWYPTARLFRQPRPGDWPSVIAEVRRQLARARRSRSARPRRVLTGWVRHPG